MKLRVRPGVDVLLGNPALYIGSSKVGLITNPTGVTSSLASTLDAFCMHPDIRLTAVFGPEHGARGDVQDALPVSFHVDDITSIPVYSLYGDIMKPTEEMLEEVDTLVFDIQDVGSRFYTYVSTLTYTLEAASEHGIAFIVLDRPNPINGISVEGNILEPGFTSFIGLHAVPIRHGMTIGELALLINERIGAELEVVEMVDWSRNMWYDETGLQWVQPSPNIATLETAIIYPGTCFFEGVNISEGRGTTHPFEYLGAPWIDGHKWAEDLNDLGLSGVIFRACYFTPNFSKYVGEHCGGVQVHLTDRDTYRPVETALHMLSVALSLWPDDFEWLPPSYDEHYHFDLLAGTDKTRKNFNRGVAVGEIIESWREGLQTFNEVRESHLLYPTGGP